MLEILRADRPTREGAGMTHDIFPLMALGERGPIYSGFVIACKECGSHRMQMPYRDNKPVRVVESQEELRGSNYRDVEMVMCCVDCGAVRHVRLQTYTFPNYALKGWRFDVLGWHCPVPVSP